MNVYKGGLVKLQHFEGENIYDPNQILYRRGIKQLKQENQRIKECGDLTAQIEGITNLNSKSQQIPS